VIRLRQGRQETTIPDSAWGESIATGKIQPGTLVFSLKLTGGLWQRADKIENFHFFRDSGEMERKAAAQPPAGAPLFGDLPLVAFPRRGVSGTEVLLAINCLVALALLLMWGESYTERIFGARDFVPQNGEGLAWDFYRMFVDDRIPAGFVASLFVHANLRHFGANMITLIPAAAFAEYFYGRGVYLIYLIGGLGGAVMSFMIKNHGPMSVGASGAIYALIGASGGFIFRHYGSFRQWQRWRARRVYIPLLVIATMPSLFHADWRAHLGGLLTGLVLGLAMPAGKRVKTVFMPAHNQKTS
jgi:membrane associated rhomboid family serine protease